MNLDIALPDTWLEYEPNSYSNILAARGNGPRRLNLHVSDTDLLDRIHGGWLGRTAGCTLGKPVEGWTRAEIESYLFSVNAWPLRSYIPFTETPPRSEGGCPLEEQKASCLGHIDAVPQDDDIDYTIIGLTLLERCGTDFRTQDVGVQWLDSLPYNRVYTAEHVAYRNLVMGLEPPDTATHDNPYGEWIGAQIRADIFGYICPGNPEHAAQMAYRDATLSHIRNGVYGSMFVAAAIATAFTTRDIESVIRTALAEIPAQSRTADLIRDVLTWAKAEHTWEAAWERLNHKWGVLHRIHTLNNLGLVLLSLLYGDGDFGKTTTLAVRGGWDTDCNGATAGSILGVMFGVPAIDPMWVEPFHDTVRSAVFGHSEVRLSELANRTWQIARCRES